MPVRVGLYLVCVLRNDGLARHVHAHAVACVVTRSERATDENHRIEPHEPREFSRAPRRATAASGIWPPELYPRHPRFLSRTVNGKVVAEQSALMPDPLAAFLYEALRVVREQSYRLHFPGSPIHGDYRNVSDDGACRRKIIV